ncbi:hypothetical protein FC701_10080 [Bacillus mycoides]|uniref:Uncharacterized protein n=1 Tax=Bacillus mycoides TaxID=1405 RepID=A0A4U3ACN5_BACMY|nr:hypothetical protein FC701_10080 [Bacillus mycoides]
MNYIYTYQYTEIHAIELEILKYCIRFLFIYLIVRKIGISCEVVSVCFFTFLKTQHSPYLLSV